VICDATFFRAREGADEDALMPPSPGCKLVGMLVGVVFRAVRSPPGDAEIEVAL